MPPDSLPPIQPQTNTAQPQQITSELNKTLTPTRSKSKITKTLLVAILLISFFLQWPRLFSFYLTIVATFSSSFSENFGWWGLDGLILGYLPYWSIFLFVPTLILAIKGGSKAYFITGVLCLLITIQDLQYLLSSIQGLLFKIININRYSYLLLTDISYFMRLVLIVIAVLISFSLWHKKGAEDKQTPTTANNPVTS